MLEDGIGQKILERVEVSLKKNYPFPIYQEGGVEIMGGDQEGVLAWITLNYLLGKIGGKTRVSTAGIMDLGGGTYTFSSLQTTLTLGSTQIVFEDPAIPKGEHRIDLEFSGHKYILYQHSYDGYGLMQGRKSINKASIKTNHAPCIPDKSSIDFHDDSTGSKYELKGSAKTFSSCALLIAQHLFNKQDTCTMEPCSFDGVYMPEIKKDAEFYAFSYFFDKFANPFDLHDFFYVGQIKTAANDICSPTPPPNLSFEGQKELERNKEWCTDLGFIYSLLSVGYDFPDDRKILSTKKVDGIEIGWALGCAIRMLEKFDKCF